MNFFSLLHIVSIVDWYVSEWQLKVLLKKTKGGALKKLNTN
jgi:hypothetical protein